MKSSGIYFAISLILLSFLNSHADANPLKLTLTCRGDCSYQVFVDETELTNGPTTGDWTNPSVFSLSSSPGLIAVQVNWNSGTAGLIASVSDGSTVSGPTWLARHAYSSSWNTILFPDGSWNDAVVVGQNGQAPYGDIAGVSQTADWIWTENNVGVSTDTPVFFRAHIVRTTQASNRGTPAGQGSDSQDNPPRATPGAAPPAATPAPPHAVTPPPLAQDPIIRTPAPVAGPAHTTPLPQPDVVPVTPPARQTPVGPAGDNGVQTTQRQTPMGKQTPAVSGNGNNGANTPLPTPVLDNNRPTPGPPAGPTSTTAARGTPFNGNEGGRTTSGGAGAATTTVHLTPVVTTSATTATTTTSTARPTPVITTTSSNHPTPLLTTTTTSGTSTTTAATTTTTISMPMRPTPPPTTSTTTPSPTTTSTTTTPTTTTTTPTTTTTTTTTVVPPSTTTMPTTTTPTTTTPTTTQPTTTTTMTTTTTTPTTTTLPTTPMPTTTTTTTIPPPPKKKKVPTATLR